MGGFVLSEGPGTYCPTLFSCWKAIQGPRMMKFRMGNVKNLIPCNHGTGPSAVLETSSCQKAMVHSALHSPAVEGPYKALRWRNCPAWISGRRRMAVKIISWLITTKECCRTEGSNPRPSTYQAMAHPNKHSRSRPGPARPEASGPQQTRCHWFAGGLHCFTEKAWYHREEAFTHLFTGDTSK